MGGKPEMLRLGHLDDVDMGMMIHATSRREEGKLAVPMSNNGCVVKTVRYIGAPRTRRAPAPGRQRALRGPDRPHGHQRDPRDVRDEDTIRVHPIITHGGSQVNVIPRGAARDLRARQVARGHADADRKVDRALRAGAMALGCTVEIETLPGYMPLRCDPLMVERFRAIAADLVGEDNVRTIRHRTGSTDMGDLAQIMPIIHPTWVGHRHAARGGLRDSWIPASLAI